MYYNYNYIYMYLMFCSACQDHSTLCIYILPAFYLNSIYSHSLFLLLPLPSPPPLSVCVVDDGAILDVQFSDFSFPPPDGFDRIMFEKNIL